MTTLRPDLWPLHDLLGTNVEWPEDSLYLQSGYPTGLAVPSDDHNGKMNRAGLWAKHLDLNGVRNSDWFDTTVAAMLSTRTLTYLVGGNVLTTGAVVDTRGTFLINGTRIETDTAFLNQVGANVQGDNLIHQSATAPGRIWIYANEDGTPRFESVGPAVADTPGVGEITLNGVQIDALGVVTIGDVAPITLPLPEQIVPIVQRLSVVVSSVNPAVTIDNNAGLGLNVTTGGASVTGDSAITGAVFITGPTDITGTCNVNGEITATSTIADAILGTTSAAGVVAGVHGISDTASGFGVIGEVSVSGTGVRGVSPSGAGVVGIGGGTGAGVTGTGGSTGAGVSGTGGATSGHGISGVASAATSYGVFGTGANFSDSHGVVGIATNTSAFGVGGNTASSATSSAAGVFANALGDGNAVSAMATDGNAGVFQSDTSAPKRAAIRIVPQDADPTTTQSGALFNASSRNGKFRGHTGTAYESLHSSAKGWVFGVSSTSSGTNAASSGDIGDVTIVPEQTGDVIVTVTGFWKGSTDTTQLTVLLKDITGAVTILTTQVLVAPDRDGDGQDRTVPFTVRYPYTLPSAASRLFRYRLNFSATVDWYDTFQTVQGVY